MPDLYMWRAEAAETQVFLCCLVSVLNPELEDYLQGFESNLVSGPLQRLLVELPTNSGLGGALVRWGTGSTTFQFNVSYFMKKNTQNKCL